MTPATDTPDEVLEGQGRELARPTPRPAALAPAPSPATLWRTDDPAEVVKRATAAADALAPVIKAKGMSKNLGGERDHVQIEGWQTLGSMVGVVSTPAYKARELPWPADEHLTDQLREIRDSGFVFGYEAAYTAKTIAGVEIGGAEGVCKRTEARWCKRPKYEWQNGPNGREKVQVGEEAVEDFALLGMAQTRAQSRCFASPLRFVVELAGFSGTPAEEMTEGMVQSNGGGSQVGFASDKQEGFLRNLLGEKGLSDDDVELVCTYAAATMSGSRGGPISNAIDGLKGGGDQQAQLAQQMLTEAQAWHAKENGAPVQTPPSAAGDELAAADEPAAAAEQLPEERVSELMAVITRLGLGFNRLGALIGSVGGERPAINRADSIAKSIRNLSAEQADKLEAKFNTEADRSGS